MAVQRLFPVFPCCWYWEASSVRYICLAGNWCSVLEVGQLLRVFRPICNICVMLPLLGHMDWAAAEVLFAACMAQESECMVGVQQKSQPKGELPGLTGGDKRLSTELEEEPAFSLLHPSSPFPSSFSYIGCLLLSCPLLPSANIFGTCNLIPYLRGGSPPVAILFHSFTPVNANGKLSSVTSVLRRRNICETKRSKGKKCMGGKEKIQ